jgi:arsenate reductase (thioredoxin)
MKPRIGVIFVSRRNSLRSILAQACLENLDSKRRFAACSCGQPGQISRSVHPAAIGALNSAGIPVPSQPPRNWDELVRSGLHGIEFVILLDPALQPLEPRWPGQPDEAVWDYPDAAAGDNPEQTAHAAIQTLFSLKRRLELLVSLPMNGADKGALRSDVRDLAYMR